MGVLFQVGGVFFCVKVCDVQVVKGIVRAKIGWWDVLEGLILLGSLKKGYLEAI